MYFYIHYNQRSSEGLRSIFAITYILFIHIFNVNIIYAISLEIVGQFSYSLSGDIYRGDDMSSY